MKTHIIVMAHRGVQATVDRHRQYWTRWGDVTFLCGQDDCLAGEQGLQWCYGPAQHYGYESNRKVLLGIKQATQGMPTNIIFIEYDAIILGQNKDWLKQVPQDAIWCPRFSDTRDNRGFIGTTFCHPPLVMNCRMACHLVEAMEKLGPGVESGFWDRYVGLACERYGIKIQDMLVRGEAVARNPIEGHYVEEACEGVRRGARFVHGIKDEQTLRRIEACVPADL